MAKDEKDLQGDDAEAEGGSNKKLLEVVDFLIEKERQAATGATPEAVH